MKKITEVKIFGLQRTGTCYLDAILRRNYHVKVLNNKGGWKHGEYTVLDEIGREVDCVAVVKHPVSWLVSAYRRLDLMQLERDGNPIDFTGSFEEFVFDDRAINFWNQRYRHWLSVKLDNHKMIFVRYEDLLRDPEGECKRIASTTGLLRKSKSFIDVTNTIHPLDPQDREIIGSTPFDRSYYTEHKYLKNYNLSLIDYVAKRLDWEIMNRFAYEIETSRQMLSESTIKLNLGCGKDIKEGYINIDIRPLPGVDKVTDVSALPYKNGSVDEIYASDIIEHFPMDKTLPVIREWRRVLKPGGKLYIRCPDLEKIAEAFCQKKIDARLASHLIYGGQDYPENFHYAGFDKAAMSSLLEKAGFKILKITNTNYNMNIWGQKKNYFKKGV